MTTTEKTKVIEILSNIFIKDYGYCSQLFKEHLVETNKLPLNVLSRIMSQPTLLVNEFDFSIVVWLYQILIDNSKYHNLLPVPTLIFGAEELQQAENYIYKEDETQTQLPQSVSLNKQHKVTNRTKTYYYSNKNEFLKDITKNKDEKTVDRLYTAYCGIFNKLEDIEKLLNKEVNMFSVDELLDLCEKNGWTTFGSFRVRKSLLKTYITWLNKKQNIVSKGKKTLPIEMINMEHISGITKVRQLFIKDFEELQDMIETVFDTDQYIMFKLFCYLSWFGFIPEELYELLKSDVDFANSAITSWKTGYSVSRLPECVMDLCRECATAVEYVHERINREAILTYKDNKYLFRSFNATNQNVVMEFSDKPININFVTRHYRTWNKLSANLGVMHPHYGRDLSVQRIYKSGMYYKIYEYEQANSIENITQKHIDELCRIPEDTGKVILVTDYLQWKNAFYM